MSMLLNIFENFLGAVKKHNETTGQLSVNCPLCDDGKNKGNLEINYNKGLYKCWSCYQTNNMHGSIPKLIKKYGTKRNLRDYLLLRPRIIYNNEYDNNIEDETPELILPEGFRKLINCTKDYWKCDTALRYLRKRGITDEIIECYNIGYTIEGTYANRIIIPSYDEFGDLNYFVARSFEKWVKPKYLNPVVNKQSIIFNEKLINWDATIYLTEGAFDHIVIPNSIPLLGKYMYPRLFNLLQTKANANVVVLLDEDAIADAKELYRQLNTLDLYGRVMMCVPPYKHDPSSIFEKLGRKGIVSLLKNATY